MIIIKLGRHHSFQLNFYGELVLSLAITLTTKHLLFVMLDSAISALIGLLCLLLVTANVVRSMGYRIRLINYKRRFLSPKCDWVAPYPLHPTPQKPVRFRVPNSWKNFFFRKLITNLVFMSLILGISLLIQNLRARGFVVQIPLRSVIVFYQFRRLLFFLVGSVILVLGLSGIEKRTNLYMFKLEMFLTTWLFVIVMLWSNHNGKNHLMIQQMNMYNAVEVCRKIRYPIRSYGFYHQLYNHYHVIQVRTQFNDKDTLAISTSQDGSGLVVTTPRGRLVRTRFGQPTIGQPKQLPGKEPLFQIAPPIMDRVEENIVGELFDTEIDFVDIEPVKDLEPLNIDKVKYIERELQHKYENQKFSDCIKNSYDEGDYKSLPKPIRKPKFERNSLAERNKAKIMKKQEKNSWRQSKRAQEDRELQTYWQEQEFEEVDYNNSRTDFEEPIKTKINLSEGQEFNN